MICFSALPSMASRFSWLINTHRCSELNGSRRTTPTNPTISILSLLESVHHNSNVTALFLLQKPNLIHLLKNHRQKFYDPGTGRGRTSRRVILHLGQRLLPLERRREKSAHWYPVT